MCDRQRELLGQRDAVGLDLTVAVAEPLRDDEQQRDGLRKR